MLKMLLVLTVGGLLLANESAKAQTTRPCPGNFNPTWTECVGARLLPDGAKYVGEFRDGQYSGLGMYTYQNGEKYVGTFRAGKRSGQGTQTFPNGERYVGEWRDDEKNGLGTYTFPDGGWYFGEYRNDKRNGHGDEYNEKTGKVRSGDWSDGNFVGARPSVPPKPYPHRAVRE